ncbi:MAG: hypothetical protein GY842_22955 [bacterium]|nr:hypothetical protein [bacterium]
MVLNYHSQHENHTGTTEHLKDSTFKMAVVGYGIPLCILAVVVANIVVGKAFTPAGRATGDVIDGLVQSYAFGWQFAGVVLLKMGSAAALFSWYALANYKRTELWAPPALLASVVVMVLGLVAFAVGFFV